MSNIPTMTMENFLRGPPMRLVNFVAGAPQPVTTIPIRYDTRDSNQVTRIKRISQRAYALGLEPTFVRNPRRHHEIIMTLAGPQELVLRSLNANHRTTHKISSSSKRKSSPGSSRRSSSGRGSTRRRQRS